MEILFRIISLAIQIYISPQTYSTEETSSFLNKIRTSIWYPMVNHALLRVICREVLKKTASIKFKLHKSKINKPKILLKKHFNLRNKNDMKERITHILDIFWTFNDNKQDHPLICLSLILLWIGSDPPLTKRPLVYLIWSYLTDRAGAVPSWLRHNAWLLWSLRDRGDACCIATISNEAIIFSNDEHHTSKNRMIITMNFWTMVWNFPKHEKSTKWRKTQEEATEKREMYPS